MLPTKPSEYDNEDPRKLSIFTYQCSSLYAYLSRIHTIHNYKCNCVASFENAINYFLECPLYMNERGTLLSDCYDVNSNILGKFEHV